MPRERSRSRSRSRSPDYKRRKPSDYARREPSPIRHSSSRRDDRDRERDVDRDRERDRDRDRSRRDDRYGRDDDRDRYRDRDRDRRRHDDDRRRRDDSPVSSRRRDEDKSPRPAVPVKRPVTYDSPVGSPGPQTEEEKQRAKRERLEKWKRDREAQKAAGSSAPGTPKADSKASSSLNGSKPAGLPAKPTFSLSTSTLSRIGLPVKPGKVPSKTTAVLDDAPAPSRTLQTLTLPPVDPEANPDGVEAVEEPEPEIVKRGIKLEDDSDDDAMQGIQSTNGRPKTRAKVEVKKEEEDEDEEDPLDAYMNVNSAEVREVDKKDAHKTGSRIAAVDRDEGVSDEEVVDAKQKELQTKEAILAQAAAKTRKKDLPAPDHSLIEYEPFRKAFYTPPQEIAEMTEEDSELMRLEMGSIKIRGKDAPKPVRNWGAFGLPAGVLDVIKRNGYEAPTPIQAQTVPAIMSGRDVIGVAKTGSGKTLAFLLPLFRHIKAQRPLASNEGPIALIMTPTRELALQIHKEAKPFLKTLGMKGTTVYGGAPISEQIAAMKTGAELVVCTPGRMIDLLTANSGRVVNLRRVTYLVLDEADRMFDMGFEPQVMKIIGLIRPDRQTVLFSATFPKLMESLASRILINKLEITVGGRSVVAPEIDQRVEIRTQESKFNRLLEILGEMGELHGDSDFRTLIFVDRQESADDLFHNLLQRGYVSTSLHGGKEQVDRDEAIKNFQKGDIPIVVATSVAARGLDVKELKLVINYDCPNHLEDYVHRAGRTGRAGNKGTCITFITPEQEKFSVDIVAAMTQSNAYISDELKAMSDGFKAKIKAGRAKAPSSGFRGKGLDKLEARRNEKDVNERSTYGDTTEATSLSSREGALVAYRPEPKKGAAGGAGPADMRGEHDYTFSDIHVEIVHGPAPDKLPSALAGSGVGDFRIPPHTLAALAKARAEGRTVDAERLQIAVNKLQQSIMASKAERFGAATLDPGRKTKDPDATDYHAIFPINDFPQKARWKATNKEQMVQLIEMSQASITNKGIFYGPGQEPGPGDEPKLHLLIESNDEAKVRIAVDELRRILTEASFAALQTADRGSGPAGRYTV